MASAQSPIHWPHFGLFSGNSANFCLQMGGVKEIHPLKRKSIKPSSSTVRGMLPPKQFKNLDAALQSLRAAGLRFEWVWHGKDAGWVCAGLYEDVSRCELIATLDPLVGRIVLSPDEWEEAKKHKSIPEKFRKALKIPFDQTKDRVTFEIELDSTGMRDLFSDFIESLHVVWNPKT